MPTWQDFQPFIVAGLALGGVYALSGVGMVVLYRATGVLNLSFGAVGAMGAFLAWSLINDHGSRPASPTSSAWRSAGSSRSPTASCSARRSPPATRWSRPSRRSAWR